MDAQVATARTQAELHGIRNVEFVEASIDDLPFARSPPPVPTTIASSATEHLTHGQTYGVESLSIAATTRRCP